MAAAKQRFVLVPQVGYADCTVFDDEKDAKASIEYLVQDDYDGDEQRFLRENKLYALGPEVTLSVNTEVRVELFV